MTRNVGQPVPRLMAAISCSMTLIINVPSPPPSTPPLPPSLFLLPLIKVGCLSTVYILVYIHMYSIVYTVQYANRFTMSYMYCTA